MYCGDCGVGVGFLCGLVLGEGVRVFGLGCPCPGGSGFGLGWFGFGRGVLVSGFRGLGRGFELSTGTVFVWKATDRRGEGAGGPQGPGPGQKHSPP